MDQQQRIPSSVHVGTSEKKGEKFDDSEILTKEGGFSKINAIKIYYNEKYVLGITIYYKLIDGQYLKATHNPQKDKKNIQKRVLEIGPDDYLKEVSGHVTEKGITRISFSTYRGKEGVYGGNDQGQPFMFKFEGQTFGAFKGGFKDHLLFLDIPVYPAPAEFLKELAPIQINFNVIQNVPEQNKNALNQQMINQIPQQKPLPGGNGGAGLSVQQQNQVPQQNLIQQPPQFKGIYVAPQNSFGQVYVPMPINNQNAGNPPAFQPYQAYQIPPQNFQQQPQAFQQNYSYPIQSQSVNGNKQSFQEDNQSVMSSQTQPVLKSKYPTFK